MRWVQRKLYEPADKSDPLREAKESFAAADMAREESRMNNGGLDWGNGDMSDAISNFAEMMVLHLPASPSDVSPEPVG